MNSLSSPLCKNISVFPNPKSELYGSLSRPTEGRVAIVTAAGRDAVDADALEDERRVIPPSLKLRRTGTKPVEAFGVDGCGRRRRVVLTPRRWRQVRERQLSRATVARKPGRRGEHEISRKPLRRECRIASAEPVCSCAFSCALFAHETAGAARTRYSLRPLIGGQGNFWQTSGLVAREIAKLCLPMTRCLKFESLPSSSANGSALGAAR